MSSFTSFESTFRQIIASVTLPMDSQNNHNNKLEEEDEEEVLVVARPPKRSLIGSLFHSVHTYIINPFLIGGSATIGIGFGKKFLSTYVNVV